MKRASILTGAAVVLGIAAQSWGNLLPVNSNTVVQDGIEYYIQTDKRVYDLEQDVEILYRVTNLRDEEWEVKSWYPVCDISVGENPVDEFAEIWSLHWYGGGHTGPAVLRLQPSESEVVEAVWAQINHQGTREIEDDTVVLPGVYRVLGVIEALDRTVAVDITIIPEPASLALFAGGIGILNWIGRRRKR